MAQQVYSINCIIIRPHQLVEKTRDPTNPKNSTKDPTIDPTKDPTKDLHNYI